MISQRLFNGLTIEFGNLPFKVCQDLQPQLWHDSLSLTRKRAQIGLVPGETREARAGRTITTTSHDHARPSQVSIRTACLIFRLDHLVWLALTRQPESPQMR